MIEFLNLTDSSFEKRFFVALAKKVLKEENREGDISVVLVDEEKMRELNNRYRKKDKSTNVLSFCYQEGEKFVFPSKNLLKLGEVILCPFFIKKQAQERGLDFKEELARTFIHGILHLLGYNHNTTKKLEMMEALQEKYLSH